MDVVWWLVLFVLKAFAAYAAFGIVAAIGYALVVPMPPRENLTRTGWAVVAVSASAGAALAAYLFMQLPPSMAF